MHELINLDRRAERWPSPEVRSDETEDGPLVLLHAVLHAARRSRFRLLIWVFLCALIATVYARAIPPTFTASALLLLEVGRSPAGPERPGSAQPVLDIFRAESELEVIRSERLLSKVFDSLGLNSEEYLHSAGASTSPLGALRKKLRVLFGGESTSPSLDERRQHAFAEFARRVGVRRVGQSYVVEVSFSGPDPSLARRVANAVVSAYLWQSVLLKADAARSGSEFLQGRVNALSAQISAAAEAVATGTLPQTAMPDADARVIGAALQPLAPSAPRTKLIIAFGAVLGFLTGLFAIVIAYALDRRIYTTQDLVRVSRLPCLAAVTEAPRRERLARAAVSPSERSASSYSQDGFALSLRDLKTALGIELKRHSPGANPVIAFVSWRSGAGCTLLCRKLAEIMQETGSDIFLIDADLRAPGPAVAKEYESEHSLAYALRADVQPAGIMFARRGGVSLLPARSPEQTTNYLADLSSSKMTELISYIRARGPVLLDLPPLQRTADAQAGALQADLVVIVARAGSTTADDVLSAAASLRHVGAHVVGTVLTGARPQGR